MSTKLLIPNYLVDTNSAPNLYQLPIPMFYQNATNIIPENSEGHLDLQPDLHPYLVNSITARGAGRVRHLTGT
jgi:hypothetical protein